MSAAAAAATDDEMLMKHTHTPVMQVYLTRIRCWNAV